MTTSTTYSLTNLPSGFVYNPNTQEIFSPVTKSFYVLNADESITSSTNVTFQSVDDFVSMHLFMMSDKFRNRRDRVSERFECKYTTISPCCGKSYIIEKDTLTIIMCVAIPIILAILVTIPIHYFLN